jgi:hypothetical protein
MMSANMRMTLLSAACLVGLTAGHGAQAQELAPVVKATASFSQLGYRLIDLDPNDGVTPWVKLSDSATDQGYDGGAFAYGQGLNSDYTDDGWPYHYNTYVSFAPALPTETVSIMSTDGTTSASISPTGVGSSAWLSAEHFDRSQPAFGGIGPTYLDVHSYTGKGSPFFSQQNLTFIDAGPQGILYDVRSPDDFASQLQYAEFELSANTAIVFEGSSTLDALVDLTALPEGATATAQASLQFEVFADQPLSGVGPFGGLEAVEAFGYQSMSRFVDGAAFNSEDLGTQALGLTFRNTTGQSVAAHLSYGTYTGARIEGLPVVPEPATDALMGLGMIGLMGLARAKRRV